MFTKNKIITAMALTVSALSLNAQANTIDEARTLLVNAETSNSALTTEATALLKKGEAKAFIGASNNGSEYTSSFALIAGGAVNIGEGKQIGFSLIKGVPGLDNANKGDTKGGSLYYQNATAKYGTFGAEASYLDYEVGGDYQDLNIKGSTKKLALTHEYSLSESFKIQSKILHVEVNGQFNSYVDSNYGFTALSVGGEYKEPGMVAKFAVEKGLNGSDSYDAFNEKFENDFTIVKADIKQEIPLNLKYVDAFELNVGGQAGSDGTPLTEQFVAGGFNRGSSFSTGYKSAPTGLYVDLKAKKMINTVEYFAGVDGSIAYPSFSENIESKSAYLGVRHYSKTEGVIVDARFAQNIGDKVTGIDNNRASLSLTKLF